MKNGNLPVNGKGDIGKTGHRTGIPPTVPGYVHHKVTPATKDTVRKMVLLGSTRPLIAGALGISPETLERHYHDTLNFYQAHMLSNVASKAYTMALKGNPVMVQFVLRTRARWKDDMFGEGDQQLIKRIIGIREEDL
jgi:hypothetical protein